MGTYKDLLVWQKSMELVKAVYQLTADFPMAAGPRAGSVRKGSLLSAVPSAPHIWFFPLPASDLPLSVLCESFLYCTTVTQVLTSCIFELRA